MEEGTHDGLPCLVPVTAQTYLRSIPTPTADMNHGQRFGDMHIGPMLRLTPARKALMRRASKPRCTSFPKILLILSFRESWGLGTWDWLKGERGPFLTSYHHHLLVGVRVFHPPSPPPSPLVPVSLPSGAPHLSSLFSPSRRDPCTPAWASGRSPRHFSSAHPLPGDGQLN